jgi:hypothetical protein
MQSADEGRSSEIARRLNRRGQLLTVAVVIGLTAILGSLIWRMRSLDGLPDVGEPFDVALARRPVEIADAENAFITYAAARKRLLNPANPIDVDRKNLVYQAVRNNRIEALTWLSADSGSRAYLEDKRAAIELWRKGSALREALLEQPGRMSGWVPHSIEDMLVLAGLAALEGSRLENAGAKDEAWEWYRSMLRSSRLVGRHGLLSYRLIGAKIHAVAAQCILRWSADPSTTAGLLRQALDETLVADALTPPVSEAIKLDYLVWLRELENPRQFESTLRDFRRRLPLLGGQEEGLLDQLVNSPAVRMPVQRARLRANNEVERSRRAVRLLFANWLAQADRPADRRAPVAIREPTWIYADDPAAPPAARAVSPEFLVRVIDQTTIARFFFGSELVFGGPQAPPWDGAGNLARERRRRSALVVRLGAELYRRERGEFPATAGALLDAYLKELPEGIAPGDSIPARID